MMATNKARSPKHFAILTLLLAIGPMIASCAHTNELAKYNVRGASVVYRSHAAGNAQSTTSNTSTSSSGNPAIDLGAAIGNDIAANQAQQKLRKAIIPDSLAAALAVGIQKAVSDYLQMKAVSGDNSTFIVETILERYEISSSSTSISAQVQGTSRIIDRRSGKIVWEDGESETIPLRNSTAAALTSAVSDMVAGAINAQELANMSEAEMHTVLGNAAKEVGREIGEVLRKDVAKMTK
jgi:hypothetical protein